MSTRANTDTATKTKTSTTTPPMYKVMLLNDDYTTWDFVVEVLMTVFKKDEMEADRITRDVHHMGIGVAGIYSFEIAETKTEMANRMAFENGHPLQCVMEPE